MTQNRDASYTYGCLEPTAVTQMAKYLDTVYVSGWQSSSTASSSDEPGPDLADYPYVSERTSILIPTMANQEQDHRSQQSKTPFHGATIPRPQATPRTP